MEARSEARPSTTRPARKGRVERKRMVLRPSRSDSQPPTRQPSIPDIAQVGANYVRGVRGEGNIHGNAH